MAEAVKPNKNLELYDGFRHVPDEAKKAISSGRLKGKTDINPMYRIKSLTEKFGACGIGWYTEITNKYILDGANGEKIAIVDIKLYFKHNGEWSKGIEGTGGSSFVANESKGLYTSDECFKMAYTDALSVACKSLGIGADVYWEADSTKYTTPHQSQPSPAPVQPQPIQQPVDPNTILLTAEQSRILESLSIEAKQHICTKEKIDALKDLPMYKASAWIQYFTKKGMIANG